MVVSSKILLKKKQPTLIQYSLVQVYHKRGMIDSHKSIFFQEAAAACWITSSSRLFSGFPFSAKCSDTLIRIFPMTKYWVPSAAVSIVPLLLVLFSLLAFTINEICPTRQCQAMCGVDCSNVNQTVSTGTKDFENNPQALYYSILLFL